MYFVTNFEVWIELFPWMRSKLFETECNTFLFFIEVKNNNVDLLIELNDFFRVCNASPAQVCDVNQTIYATKVDEYAVVSDVLNHTFENLTFLETRNNFFLLCFHLCLDKSLVRYNHIAEVLINFNNLEFHRLTNEYVVVTNRLNVDLAARQECFHTKNVHNHTAFRTAFDVTVNDFALLASVNNAVPCLSCACLFV